MSEPTTHPFWQTVKFTVRGFCPNCGEGKLFRSYLKPVDNCAKCAEPLGHIRADDGPAWLTILVIGHLLAFYLMMYTPDPQRPLWKVMAVLMAITLLLTLWMLPRAKGVFIGMIWRTQRPV